MEGLGGFYILPPPEWVGKGGAVEEMQPQKPEEGRRVPGEVPGQPC